MAEIARPPHITIIGLGGIGGLLCALFKRAGFPVSAVVSVSSAGRQDSKLFLESAFYGGIEFAPERVTTIPENTDIIMLTIKYPSLHNVLVNVLSRYHGEAIVLPLLNGVGIVEKIKQKTDATCTAGNIGMVEALRINDSLFEHRSTRKPLIQYAGETITKEQMQILDMCFNAADVGSKRLCSEAEVIWSKLTRLDVISTLTATYQRSVGELREDAVIREEMLALVSEVVAVASGEGVDITEEQVIEEIDQLPLDLTTSLQRDVAAGAPSELDVITGGVIERAKRLNLSVPTHTTFYERLTQMTQTRDFSA